MPFYLLFKVFTENCNKNVLFASFGCNSTALILPAKTKQIISIYKQEKNKK